MKTFNLGKGLMLAIVLFMIGTLSMVSYFISLDYYLVSNEHYEDAVDYQQTIDKRQRAKNLDTPVMILFDEPTVSVKIIFPNELLKTPLTGDVTFYRPNNPGIDKKFRLNINENGLQSIPLNGFEEGRWRLSVEWKADTLSYLEEKTIFI